MVADPERFREADELLDYVEGPKPEPEPEIKHLLMPPYMRQQGDAASWCGKPGPTMKWIDPDCCVDCWDRMREYAS